jgi:hypothetical protein
LKDILTILSSALSGPTTQQRQSIASLLKQMKEIFPTNAELVVKASTNPIPFSFLEIYVDLATLAYTKRDGPNGPVMRFEHF